MYDLICGNYFLQKVLVMLKSKISGYIMYHLNFNKQNSFAGKAILWIKNHAPTSEYALSLQEVTREFVEVELETVKQRRALLARMANEKKVRCWSVIENWGIISYVASHCRLTNWWSALCFFPRRPRFCVYTSARNLHFWGGISRSKLFKDYWFFIIQDSIFCCNFRSRELVLLLLVALNPLRVEPFEDLTVGNILNPFHSLENGAKVICVEGESKGNLQMLRIKRTWSAASHTNVI